MSDHNERAGLNSCHSLHTMFNQRKKMIGQFGRLCINIDQKALIYKANSVIKESSYPEHISPGLVSHLVTRSTTTTPHSFWENEIRKSDRGVKQVRYNVDPVLTHM